jgi:hypothetical protein
VCVRGLLIRGISRVIGHFSISMLIRISITQPTFRLLP